MNLIMVLLYAIFTTLESGKKRNGYLHTFRSQCQYQKNNLNFSKYNFTTFTVTVASPAVFTLTNHELYTDDTVVLETTGALPTGLSVDTTYYVIYNGITANTFRLSTTQGGTAINTSGSQSGTHTMLKKNPARFVPSYQNNR